MERWSFPKWDVHQDYLQIKCSILQTKPSSNNIAYLAAHQHFVGWKNAFFFLMNIHKLEVSCGQGSIGKVNWRLTTDFRFTVNVFPSYWWRFWQTIRLFSFKIGTGSLRVSFRKITNNLFYYEQVLLDDQALQFRKQRVAKGMNRNYTGFIC